MKASYRDLRVWQKSVALADRVYDITEQFPRHEQFGLTAQLRRAAVSVASNIAEGNGRRTSGEFAQALGHARGSLFELQTQMILAGRRAYLAQETIELVLEESDVVGRMLSKLLDYVETARDATRPRDPTTND